MNIFYKFLNRGHRLYKRKGVEGINKYIETLRRNLFLKPFFYFDDKLFSYRKALKDIEVFEKQIGKFGIRKASKNYLKRLKIELKFSKLNLQNSSVLFYSNHKAYIDPVTFLCAIQRDDIKIIATNILHRIGPNTGNFIIPVLARKYALERDDKLSIGQFVTNKAQGFTKKEINRLNQKALLKAASHIASGGVFGIYPAGSTTKIEKWYEGIGRIVSKLDKKVRQKAILSPFYLTGPTREEFRKHFRDVYKKSSTKKIVMQIHTRGTYNMYNFLENEKDPEKITDKLRVDYLKKFNNLIAH